MKLKIDEINDEAILYQVHSILNVENKIITLSTAQKKSIKKSQTDYLEGNYVENTIFNEEMEKWLKE